MPIAGRVGIAMTLHSTLTKVPVTNLRHQHPVFLGCAGDGQFKVAIFQPMFGILRNIDATWRGIHIGVDQYVAEPPASRS